MGGACRSMMGSYANMLGALLYHGGSIWIMDVYRKIVGSCSNIVRACRNMLVDDGTQWQHYYMQYIQRDKTYMNNVGVVLFQHFGNTKKTTYVTNLLYNQATQIWVHASVHY